MISFQTLFVKAPHMIYNSIMNNSYVYILRCSDNTLYTGWTNDLDKRLKAHNDGRGAKYTKPRRPCELVYSESYPDRSSAMKRESEIKRMTRSEKLELISLHKRD